MVGSQRSVFARKAEEFMWIQYNNHVPVDVLFQMFLFLLLRIILRKRDHRSNRQL